MPLCIINKNWLVIFSNVNYKVRENVYTLRACTFIVRTFEKTK